MSKKIKLGMIGATGYVGSEMLRHLLLHPHIEIEQLASRSYQGLLYSDVYKQFKHRLDKTLQDPEDEAWLEGLDVVITALPHGISSKIVPTLLDKGLKVLDHSGDFRFKSQEDYKTAYQLDPPSEALLNEAVYGLPELYREALKTTRLIANPGCYPTASILAFAPLLHHDLVKDMPLIINAMSGISGAGKQASTAYSYCEAADTVRPYGVKVHRHKPEITQALAQIANKAIDISFTPHLVPMKRGMLVSGVAFAKDSWSDEKLYELYKDFYKGEHFVRILKPGELPDTSATTSSNFIDVAAVFDFENGSIKVFSALDNLGKGAATQAIQALNLMLGFPETTGLETIGMHH